MKFLRDRKGFLFKIGLFLILVFGSIILGIFRIFFRRDPVSTQCASILLGVGFILLVPEYYYSSKGQGDARRLSYWVFSLFAGLFLIGITFIVK
jgi:hypothetical protein